MSHSKAFSTRIVALTLLGVATLASSACTNTLHGAGQDIERAGEKVQETVQ